MPLREQAIGSESAVQRTGSDAVKIRQIFSADGAETIQIKMRVANFQGIESPADGADIAAEGFFALEKFEHSTDAAITIAGVHTGHVRVEVRCAIAQAGYSERETNEAIAVERTEDLAAGIGGDNEERDGLDLEIFFFPDFALQGNTTKEFVERVAFANDDGGAASHL